MLETARQLSARWSRECGSVELSFREHRDAPAQEGRTWLHVARRKSPPHVTARIGPTKHLHDVAGEVDAVSDEPVLARRCARRDRREGRDRCGGCNGGDWSAVH